MEDDNQVKTNVEIDDRVSDGELKTGNSEDGEDYLYATA